MREKLNVDAACLVGIENSRIYQVFAEISESTASPTRISDGNTNRFFKEANEDMI